MIVFRVTFTKDGAPAVMGIKKFVIMTLSTEPSGTGLILTIG